MKNTVWIGLLASNHKRKKSLLRAYARHKPANAKLLAFTPGDVDYAHNKVRCLSFIRKKFVIKTMTLPRVIYNHIYVSDPNLFTHIHQTFGPRIIFNELNQLNKWQTYRVLSRSDILIRYLPLTTIYDYDSFTRLLDSEEPIVFLKPCAGHHGNGVYRIQKLGGVITVSEHSLRPKFIWNIDESLNNRIEELVQGKDYMAQQNIDFIRFRGSFFDIRALVQKNRFGEWQVSSMVSRITYSKYFNVSVVRRMLPASKVLRILYSKEAAMRLQQEIRAVSLLAARSLEEQFGLLGELSVDFGIDHLRRSWIIEVNGKPQKSVIAGALGRRGAKVIYRTPLEYAVFLAKNDFPKQSPSYRHL